MIRFFYYGSAVVIMFALLLIGVEPILAGIISFFAVVGGYIYLWHRFSARRNNILDEKCAPMEFMEEYEKAKRLSKRSAFQNTCNVNIAVGLISLGKNAEALDFLRKNIDLGAKNSKQFKAVYHLALFAAYINMDDFENAAYEFENNLRKLRKTPLAPRTAFAIDISVLEYQYKRNRSDETAGFFLEQLDYLYNQNSKRLSKRTKLDVLYDKAETMLALSDLTGAAENYKAVAENGNELWIAEMSRKKLAEIGKTV